MVLLNSGSSSKVEDVWKKSYGGKLFGGRRVMGQAFWLHLLALITI